MFTIWRFYLEEKMPKLLRYPQKLFGINAGANQMSKYGSANSTKETYSGATITPAIVQALPEFLQGFYAALGGAYSPTTQDLNSLFYNSSYNDNYFYENGIPEWDPDTTYFLDSFCRVGNVLYYSLDDDNLNENPVTEITKWKIYTYTTIAPTQRIIDASETYTVPSGPAPIYLWIQAWGGGGGGEASEDTTPYTSPGTNGGDTLFGAMLTAEGGKSGANGGLGGDYIIDPSGFNIYGFGIKGQQGSDAGFLEMTTVVGFSISTTIPGGNGGQSPLLNGAGPGGGNNSPAFAGYPANTNSGSGGGGGGFNITASAGATLFAKSGRGGGSGAYIDVILANPNAGSTFSVVIGDAGVRGTPASFHGSLGGNAGKGKMIITEYY